MSVTERAYFRGHCWRCDRRVVTYGAGPNLPTERWAECSGCERPVRCEKSGADEPDQRVATDGGQLICEAKHCPREAAPRTEFPDGETYDYCRHHQRLAWIGWRRFSEEYPQRANEVRAQANERRRERARRKAAAGGGD